MGYRAVLLGRSGSFDAEIWVPTLEPSLRVVDPSHAPAPIRPMSAEAPSPVSLATADYDLVWTPTEERPTAIYRRR